MMSIDQSQAKTDPKYSCTLDQFIDDLKKIRSSRGPRREEEEEEEERTARSYFFGATFVGGAIFSGAVGAGFFSSLCASLSAGVSIRSLFVF